MDNKKKMSDSDKRFIILGIAMTLASPFIYNLYTGALPNEDGYELVSGLISGAIGVGGLFLALFKIIDNASS